MKLRLTDFDSNTYEDTDGSCEMCMWTGFMDHPIYTFTDSNGGVHTVDGWWKNYGYLNTYDVNLPVFATWLHDAEFKEPIDLEDYSCLTNETFWEEFLQNILDSASYCSTVDRLTQMLGWALQK